MCAGDCVLSRGGNLNCRWQGLEKTCDCYSFIFFVDIRRAERTVELMWINRMVKLFELLLLCNPARWR